MANWIGKARSNYFHVSDEAAFRATMAPIEKAGVTLQTKTGDPTLFMVYAEEGDGWPTTCENDDSDVGEDGTEEFDIADVIATFLPEGEVAIFMEVGWEAMRYVTGFAVAINHAGERRWINLRTITELAKELGTIITEPEY